MKDIISSAMPDNPLNLFFLLLFVAVFAGVAWYNTRPSRRAAHKQAAQMPLND